MLPYKNTETVVRLALASLLLRLLEDLLDDLLLLDQESADDTVLDATGAAGATVGTADILLGARDLGVLARAKGGDLESVSSYFNYIAHGPPLFRL